VVISHNISRYRSPDEYESADESDLDPDYVSDKRPYCYYCGVQQSQVQRQGFSKHGSERKVIEIGQCKDKGEKRSYFFHIINGFPTHWQKLANPAESQV